jgi:hypothetical protein
MLDYAIDHARGGIALTVRSSIESCSDLADWLEARELAAK